MEKHTQQEHKAPLEEKERQRSGAADQSAVAASAYARRALAAGLPADLLPPQAAWALAKEIGNSAFLSLLHPGRELLTAMPPDLTGGVRPDAYPIKTRPPALAQPLRLNTGMTPPEAFELTGGMWGAGQESPPFAAPDMGGTHA